MKTLRVLFGIAGILASSLFAQLPGDEKWSTDYSAQYGSDGPIYCMVESGGKIYFGGNFTRIGTLNTRNFAVYDKTTNSWSGAGSGFGTDGSAVYSISITSWGTLVGGLFTSVGGTQGFHNVALEVGTGIWDNLGAGVDGPVYATAKIGEKIYVGGTFNLAGTTWVKNIAAYGPNWSSLDGLGGGVGSLDGYPAVYTICDGGTYGIFIGGKFTDVYYGSTPYAWGKNVVRYQNNTWHPVGWGVADQGVYGPGYVTSIAVTSDPTYQGGWWAYVGGRFWKTYTQSGEGNVHNIARFRSATGEWYRLGSSISNNGVTNSVDSDAEVNSIGFDGTNLWVAGDFDQAGNTTGYRGLARWNGSTWEKFGADLVSATRPCIKSLRIVGNDIHVSGIFEMAGSYLANNTATLDRSDWTWYSYGGNNSGVNGSVYAVGRSGGDVFVGGDFSTAGGKRIRNVVKYNLTTKTWSPLSVGIQLVVKSIAVVNSSEIYCGVFAQGFDLPSLNSYGWITKWNGTQWTQIGGMLKSSSGLALASVNAIAVVNSNEIYVGGVFSSGFNGQSEITLNNIAKYNGGTWTSVGNGLYQTTGWAFPEVKCMVYNAGSLYVGGNFKRAFQSGSGFVDVSGLAKWNINSWSAVGQPLSIGGVITPIIQSIAVSENLVTVGGLFDRAGSQTDFGNIAQWNGSSWNSLNGGGNNRVYSISHVGNRVFATGDFTSIGGQNRQRIAYWDMATNQWTQMGSGLDGIGSAINVAYTGGFSWKYDLFVGGYFGNAGGTISDGIARWTDSKINEEEQKILPELAPTGFLLSQNAPNPFNPTTTIRYELPSNEFVSISVYNILGHKVKTLVNSQMSVGKHSVEWDGTDEAARVVESGVYVYRIMAGSFQSSRKMLFLK